MSDVTCHKFGNKGHIHKECRSKGTGSSGKPAKKSTNELLKWFTKNPVVLDTKYIATSTMNCNKKYKL